MRFSFIFTFLLIVSAGASQSIEQNDNIYKKFPAGKELYAFSAPEFSPWIDTKNIILFGQKKEWKQNEFLFVATKDSMLTGALHVKDSLYFLIDMDGDSLLETRSDYFFVPVWVIKQHSSFLPGDTTALHLINTIYQKTLQTGQNQLDEKTGKEFTEYRTNQNLPNRHIIYLLDSYQLLVSDAMQNKTAPPYKLGLTMVYEFAQECQHLFGKIPAIAAIYMGEMYLSNGKTALARDHFKMVLKDYPDSVPIQIYNAKLEPDEAKRKQKLAALKSKYPKHFMLR
jgi:hypothetical protein